ncbi:membrane protein [Mycolicibacter hiberniae]|uniref:Membrane protein n=2 Tax=Mycolicibacter TaxID=1073531 RepID=A0A7I7X2L3_9MYCO|nr:membrane protein [Mycolicibacter hiberniae]
MTGDDEVQRSDEEKAADMTQRPDAPDPWRGFRGVMSATLILEAITVLLALPVVSVVGGGLTPFSLAYLLGLALVLLAFAGIQGRSWAIWANLALQAVLVAGFVVYPGVGVMGLVFTAVWVLIAYFRAVVMRRS